VNRLPEGRLSGLVESVPGIIRGREAALVLMRRSTLDKKPQINSAIQVPFYLGVPMGRGAVDFLAEQVAESIDHSAKASV